MKGDQQRRPAAMHTKAQIAERLAAAQPAPLPEGVVPLNPGFFGLQRLRGERVAKVRSK